MLVFLMPADARRLHAASWSRYQASSYGSVRLRPADHQKLIGYAEIRPRASGSPGIDPPASPPVADVEAANWGGARHSDNRRVKPTVPLRGLHPVPRSGKPLASGYDRRFPRPARTGGGHG